MDSFFGVGVQVFVQDASPADPSPWPEEPSGIIVRSAGSAIHGVWGRAGGARIWWVEFDEPQFNSRGEGPFPTAHVHEKYLVTAPPYEHAEAEANVS